MLKRHVRRSPAASGCDPGGLTKKVVRPSHRRKMTHRAVEQFAMSVRSACAGFSISEACYWCSMDAARASGLGSLLRAVPAFRSSRGLTNTGFVHCELGSA